LQRSASGRTNMTLPAPTYDLVLLLDPQADDATRAKLVADTKASIEGQGELLRHDDWGERALAYQIDHKANAQYHLMQFHVSEKPLLDGLDRTLRLADEVIRFRIIKLAPGVPAAPDMSSGAGAAPRPDEASGASGEQTPAAPVEAPPEPAPVAEAPPEVQAPAPDAGEGAPAPAEADSDADAEVAVGDPS
jgi:small subunit ribosomal protein S6